MNVSSLDNLLQRLADLMDAAEVAKGSKEIRDLANKLAPFGSLSFNDFAAFLAKAEAYSRGDLESVFPKAKSTKATKTSKAPEDPDAVTKLIAELRTLFERALDPGFHEDQVADALAKVEKLSAPKVAEIAKGCGFNQKFAKKQLALDAMRKWILGRKGTYERAGA